MDVPECGEYETVSVIQRLFGMGGWKDRGAESGVSGCCEEPGMDGKGSGALMRVCGSVLQNLQ